MLSAEPRGGGENDGSADVLVCHIVDYPQGLICFVFLFFNRGPFLNELIDFLSQVSKKQTTKQTRLLLSFAGQWASAVTFMEMAPVISNKARGALAQSISIIYPEQNTVSSHCG